jgi:hypothetical protein
MACYRLDRAGVALLPLDMRTKMEYYPLGRAGAALLPLDMRTMK